eukprot:Pgem_evm1s492
MCGHHNLKCNNTILKKLLIVNYYNAPTTPTNDKLLDEIITIKNTQLIMIGDFNGHHARWNSAKTTPTGATLAKFIHDNNLQLANSADT